MVELGGGGRAGPKASSLDSVALSALIMTLSATVR